MLTGPGEKRGILHRATHPRRLTVRYIGFRFRNTTP
jgi:hypothetical protein